MRRALCIGINDYPGTGADLSGCVNDANDWAQAWDYRGFDDVQVLVDQAATRQNILQGIATGVGQLDSGDILVVCYSGHGTWVPDMSGDEPDRRDEALCPYDYRSGVISDDDLFRLFTVAHRQARCIMISDSCHSGTVNRLADPLGDGDRGRVRFLPPELALSLSADELPSAAATPRVVGGPPRASALLLAGCHDVEYSYDASFDGRPNGAFTKVAIDALEELPEEATFRQWIAKIRQYLPSQDYPQTPQLHGGAHQKRWLLP